MKLLAADRKRINNRIHAQTATKYFDYIPLGTIDNILRKFGFWMLQEDGQPWSGFLCGESGQCLFDLGNDTDKIKNAVLVLCWYKMQSGRYEIVSYVS